MITTTHRDSVVFLIRSSYLLCLSILLFHASCLALDFPHLFSLFLLFFLVFHSIETEWKSASVCPVWLKCSSAHALANCHELETNETDGQFMKRNDPWKRSLMRYTGPPPRFEGNHLPLPRVIRIHWIATSRCELTLDAITRDRQKGVTTHISVSRIIVSESISRY